MGDHAVASNSANKSLSGTGLTLFHLFLFAFLDASVKKKKNGVAAASQEIPPISDCAAAESLLVSGFMASSLVCGLKWRAFYPSTPQTANASRPCSSDPREMYTSPWKSLLYLPDSLNRVHKMLAPSAYFWLGIHFPVCYILFLGNIVEVYGVRLVLFLVSNETNIFSFSGWVQGG